MKVGDIVYFKESHRATYGKTGGSYQYFFTPGVKYQIISVDVYDAQNDWTTGVIQNLEDKSKHFAHSTIFSKLIRQDEWRDISINKLILDK